MARILVIEDDRDIARIIEMHLIRQGHTCTPARDGDAGLQAFGGMTPDLVVLDLMLPGIDGLEVCRRIRATSHVPILMLTSRRDEVDKVIGLELGADDYLTKPFGIREFLSRVKSLLRRREWDATQGSGAAGNGVIERGDLIIDTSGRTVALKGEPVALTASEFDILATLARKPGVVLTRVQLQDMARGVSAVDSYDRSIDSILTRIRKKLGDDSLSPKYIVTVRGVGYKFMAE